MINVYVWAFESTDKDRPVCEVYATRDDGECIAHVQVPARIYARREIIRAIVDGVQYNYIDLLGLTEAELDAHPELQAAMKKAVKPEKT